MTVRGETWAKQRVFGAREAWMAFQDGESSPTTDFNHGTSDVFNLVYPEFYCLNGDCWFEIYRWMVFIMLRKITLDPISPEAFLHLFVQSVGFPGGSVVKSTCKCGRQGFNPRVGKSPWRREWQPTPVFMLDNSTDREAWRATVRGVAESDTPEATERPCSICLSLSSLFHFSTLKVHLYCRK